MGKGSLNFQFKGMFVVSLSSRTFHSGTKTSISTELKFMEIESKNLWEIFLEDRVGRTMSYSTPWFLNHFILYHIRENVPFVEQ